MSAPMVLPFARIRQADLPLVGGKGANLGELAAAGFPVPGGFCLTTEAFRAVIAGVEGLQEEVAALDDLDPEDVPAARAAGAALRAHIEGAPLPEAVRAPLVEAWRAESSSPGAEQAYAVRSSATAEDLPGASFAGQQDTYLNVVGEQALIDATRACIASLFTERAILYRARQGFSHAQVALSVVVQRMVQPRISGILFTADPLSGHRGVTAIDAGWGLGEALVSGLISADYYRVRSADGALLESRVGEQSFSIESVEGGGTRRVELEPPRLGARVCDDALLAELVALGQRGEAHFGAPQDMEWCVDEEGVKLVQSRPITSLFPLPEPAPSDGALHAYVSFGHFQVMTAPMSPMGRSVWQLAAPFGRGPEEVIPNPWVCEAGGRLYFDASPMLLRAPTRAVILRAMGQAEALMAASARAVSERADFRAGAKRLAVRPSALLPLFLPTLARLMGNVWLRDPQRLGRELPGVLEAELAKMQAALRGEGELADRVQAAQVVLARLMPIALRYAPQPMAGAVAEALASGMLRGRVSPDDVASLGRGLEGNITTQMDLEVGDLADLARAAPELVAALAGGERDLERLRVLDGGEAFVAALESFLERFGMRGPGEIDVGQPRWSDDPSGLLQVVAGNLSRPSGAHRAHHVEQSRQAAEALPRLLQAVGPLRRLVLRRLISVVRGLLPLREHPKYLLVRVFAEVRRLALEAGEVLVQRGDLAQVEDVFLLKLHELEQALRSTPSELQQTLPLLIGRRRAEQERAVDQRPPRVFTSEGEIVSATHSGEGFPEGALVGSPASGGVVEGVARVVTDPSRELLEAGEILVAPFTDPGWTPLFINAAGLVMEVGGVMTHGSVVAREYGIPAVVCVPDCTHTIRSGDRIRVDGDRGFVEILERAEPS